MLCQDSNVPSCSPIAPNFSPAENIEQQESRMMNLFCSYKGEYNHNLYQYENETQSSNDEQTVKANQLNTISSNISSSLQVKNSFEYKDEMNNTKSQSDLSISMPQNDFLTNLNNYSKRNAKNYPAIKSNLVKHLSDDETSMVNDKSIDDFIYESKSTFSSRQIGQSLSDTSFLNYTINNQQIPTRSILDKCKNDYVQNSQLCEQQNSNEADKHPQTNSEDNSKSDFTDDEGAIPLGMTSGIESSTNLSLHSLNKSITNIEDKHTKHKSCRMSLSEARLHGKNNSGEFVGRKPSLMTIVEDEEDDVEEEFEYEEDYEEDIENIKVDEKNINTMTKIKSLDILQNKPNEKQISNEYNNNFSFISKNFAHPSESQHNLSLGISGQMQTSNSTNSIPLNYYVKSYAGLNSKIIDLNPTDDDNEYDYEYDENPDSPISLREASDINKYSHQSGLSGSRTIEDLIEEQKKAAIASSSSAIITLAATSANDDENSSNSRRTYRKRSNISLSELVPKERACFTVEDMMRLQNINFLSNKGKNTSNNSGDVISKAHKPRYSEEEMMKDQKISIKNRQNFKADLSKQENKITSNYTNTIEEQIQLDTKSVSSRSINLENAILNSDIDKVNNLDTENEKNLNGTPENNEQKSEKSDEDQENNEHNNANISENDNSNFFDSNLIKEKAISSPEQYLSNNNSNTIKLIIILLIVQFILIVFYNRKSSN